MARQTAAWNLDELHRLPDDGNRYELVRGELFVTPPPSVAHESIANIIARKLDRYLDAENLGIVFRPRAALRIGRSETEPDLCVRPRITDVTSSWDQLPLPLLVVEVLSETTRRRDLVQKRELYRSAGIQEYWVVDGFQRCIRVVRPNSDDIVSTEILEWMPDAASQPLTLDVRSLFADALGITDGH